METLGLALRVGLSLACVLGLVWLFSKGVLKGAPKGVAGRGRVQVLARQALSRTSSVAVVQVGETALVLGVTEQQVTLLTQTGLEAVQAPATADVRTVVYPTSTEVAGVPTPAIAVTARPAPASAAQSAGHAPPRSLLAGSALSPATWTQALDALREKTVRR